MDEPTRSRRRATGRRTEVRRAQAARAEARRTRGRTRPDEGFAMSSPIALMAAAAVAFAGVGFLATDGQREQAQRTAALVSVPAQAEPATTIEATKVRRVVKRNEVYVEVYNNSNVTGLAGTTAQRITTAGWQVVATDNWYGTIPSTTIYFPERLKAAGKMLGRDLGIERVVPAENPMSMDRLTVVLTADFG